MDDHVAAILAEWGAERPDLDVTAVGVFGRISRIEQYKSAVLAGVYQRHRVDSGEYDVLAALRRAGSPYRLTPSQLYRSLLVTSATMTERLDRLERRRLVRRRPNPADRRSVQVELTARGRTIIDAAASDLVAVETALLDGLSRQEVATLATLLTKLSAHLEQGDRDRSMPPSTRPAGTRIRFPDA